jgi:hypothetical protein
VRSAPSIRAKRQGDRQEVMRESVVPGGRDPGSHDHETGGVRHGPEHKRSNTAKILLNLEQCKTGTICFSNDVVATHSCHALPPRTPATHSWFGLDAFSAAIIALSFWSMSCCWRWWVAESNFESRVWSCIIVSRAVSCPLLSCALSLSLSCSVIMCRRVAVSCHCSCVSCCVLSCPVLCLVFSFVLLYYHVLPYPCVLSLFMCLVLCPALSCPVPVSCVLCPVLSLCPVPVSCALPCPVSCHCVLSLCHVPCLVLCPVTVSCPVLPCPVSRAVSCPMSCHCPVHVSMCSVSCVSCCVLCLVLCPVSCLLCPVPIPSMLISADALQCEDQDAKRSSRPSARQGPLKVRLRITPF